MKHFLMLFALIAACALGAVEYTMQFTSNKPEAIYKAGEEIVFTGQLLADGKVAAGCTVEYKLNHHGKMVKSGKAVVSEKPLVLSTKLDKPGWVHLYCVFKKGGKVSGAFSSKIK